MKTTQREVTIRMAEGTADAVLCVPEGGGRWPAVLVWADIGGLRETFVKMGRRLAGEGYAVLVPNLFYRRGPAPQPATKPDFGTEAGRAEGMALLGSLDAERAREDARSYFAFLDAQAEVDPAKPAGVTGYCMGGALAFWTAGVLPGRVGALATFHAGRLVREGDPDSPDQAIDDMRLEALVAVAEGDEAREPEVRAVLTERFAEAGLPARVELFEGAQHGWCVPDGRTYDEALAEQAWRELLELFGRTLL